MEQRMQAAIDGIKADYEARFDSLNAEHKAETDSIRAENEDAKSQLKEEIGELKTKLETLRVDRPPERDRSPDSREQPPLAETRDSVRLGERRDNRNDPDAAADQADIAGLAADRSGREGHMASSIPRRHIFNAENVAAAGAGAALGQSVAEMFGSVPPEVGVSVSAVGFIGASMATSLVKNLYKKWKG